MLLLVDYLSVSPQLAPELKACLQPAAFALIDALTPFEVRRMMGWLDSSSTDRLNELPFVPHTIPTTDPAHARSAAGLGGAGAPQEAPRGLPAAVQVPGASLGLDLKYLIDVHVHRGTRKAKKQSKHESYVGPFVGFLLSGVVGYVRLRG